MSSRLSTSRLSMTRETSALPRSSSRSWPLNAAGTDPARPRHLVTEPGMGYRYQP